ncbi:MAG: TIR domain-containing protein [Saprospiraceae bacterium]|nr:TIR domain-containing protein [Saprospiraceae bacterium]MDZ4706635.1 TIR domain-containing protein [Saprospiraceae bacterium]
MQDQAAIKKLISNNRIKDAFDALKSALPKESDLLTLEFQWNALRREEMMGTIEFSDKTVRSNQIISALLAFTEMVEDDGQSAAPIGASTTGNSTQVTGSGNIVIQGAQGSPIHINVPAHAGNPATTSTPPPVANTAGAKKIFFSYSKYDREYLEQLLRHLSVLRRKGKIAAWDDHQILPGEEWDDAVKNQLTQADIILLLISADFLATDYIWDVEIKTAMERHAQKSVQVVPIVLRPCSWEADTPFGKLNGLPSKAKPVSSYSDRDQAWLEVVQGIERLLIPAP